MSMENEANTIDAALIKEGIDSTIKGLNVMHYDSSCESEHQQTRDSLESTLEILRNTVELLTKTNQDLMDKITVQEEFASHYVTVFNRQSGRLGIRVDSLQDDLNVLDKDASGAIAWLYTECKHLSERVNELEEMLNVSGK